MQRSAWRPGSATGHKRVRHIVVLGGVAVLVLVLPLLAGCTVQLGTGIPSATTTGPGVTVHVNVVTGQGGSTLVMLPVTINGSGPYRFAMDTGASTSLIDAPITQRLGLEVVGPPQSLSGVASQTEATPIRVENWSIGKLTLPAATVVTADLNIGQRDSNLQGLVGSDIWRQFGSVTIDYDAQTLTVERQVARASPGAPALTATTRSAPDAADLLRWRGAAWAWHGRSTMSGGDDNAGTSAGISVGQRARK